MAEPARCLPPAPPSDADPVVLLILGGLVPIAIAELSRMSPYRRAQLAEAAVDVVASTGDALTSGRVDRHSRDGRRRLLPAMARGLAALAYCPGGVTWCGQHWAASGAVPDTTTEAGFDA